MKANTLVVLDDGDTFSGIYNCSVIVLRDDVELGTEDLELLESGSLPKTFEFSVDIQELIEEALEYKLPCVRGFPV